MQSKIAEVATRFVDFVLENMQGDEIKAFPEGAAQIFFSIASEAGFEPKKVVPGKVSDERGGLSVNEVCPFIVVDKEDKPHYFATGWLDCAVRRVAYGSSRQGEGRVKLIEAIFIEIERSIPLAPIWLTPEGDLLRENPPTPLFSGLGYFVKHMRDDCEFDSYATAGIHKFCDGRIDRCRATEKNDVLICRACYLRVLFPREVKTYGQLRQALLQR